MKKFWLIILGLCSIFFVWSFTHAKDYEYTNLNITANILNDGTIDIEEDFTANFFVNKHGIIRNIPLNYSVWWKNFHINISNIYVQWKKFTTSKNNGNIEIKIWDANTTVVWEQSYPIFYSTYGLIRNFSGMWYAELYWNLVWYDFDTNINKVRATLILPKAYTWFTKDDFLITTDWRSKTIDGFEWSVDWKWWNKIIITYDKWLSAYHWITLAIKFPNNYFTFDHDRQASLSGHINLNMSKIKNSIIFWLIILAIIFAFSITIIKLIKNIIKKWKLKSKQRRMRENFEKKYPVIVQYSPPKWLTSAEVWLLLNRHESTQDLLTLVYKWANEKHIQIDNTGNFINPEFSLTKLNELPENCPEYEKNLFNDIFSNDDIFPKTVFNVKEWSNSLYYKLKDATLDLKNFWLEMEWFSKEVYDNLQTQIWCKNILIFIIGLPMLIIPACRIILILLAILPFFITIWELQETEKWAKLISHILWYKKFIKTCDENKLRLLLKEDPAFFDKTLPYAIVFGLESELINKITPIMQEMNIKSSRYNWDISEISSLTSGFSSAWDYHYTSSSDSSYNSDSGWDSWSSFDSGWSDFDSGGGWGWWGGSSW